MQLSIIVPVYNMAAEKKLEYCLDSLVTQTLADYEIIARVKQALSIPVIGNGDVTDADSARRMLLETGCDGVMIGRAARGNPWLFGQIAAYLRDGQTLPAPSLEEKKEMILRHAALQLEIKGEYTGVREMRKHLSWYTAGLPRSSALRNEVNQVESWEQFQSLVEERI